MSLKAATAVSTVLFAVLAGVVMFQAGMLSPPSDVSDYENATVTLEAQNGTTLSTVAVRIADTNRKRYVGLSNTESLDTGEGMLFVHDSEGTHGYVMRDMAFSLDIVFVAANGTVTRIHHADPDSEREYDGTGKYVLEVNRGYANRTGLDDGDSVVIPDTVS